MLKVRRVTLEGEGAAGYPVRASVASGDEAWLLETLGAVPEFGSGTWRLMSCEVLETRKKFGRRLLFLRVSYLEAGEERTADLAVKVYKHDRGAGALSALERMWKVGFRPPGEHRVPRPYGYSPRSRALLQERVAGTPWAGVLGQEPYISGASARAAEWLLRLQDSGVCGPRGTDAAVMARRRARDLADGFPEHSSRLSPVVRHLVRALEPAGALFVPSHGDYHPENVILAPGRTTVIDLDHLGWREPAFDVGYAIGQLLIMSQLRTQSFAGGARAALDFWRRYEQGGRAEWPGVAAHVGRTFLQSLHYELCVLRNGRVDLIPTWTREMQRWMESEGPETLAHIIRHS